MLLNETCSYIQTPEPRSFAGLMEMYEWNYIYIRRLCEGLDNLNGHQVSAVPGSLDLHICLLERNKYTTTILLTYYFSAEASLNEAKKYPNVQVRIYHDARQAEVLRISDQTNWKALDGVEPDKPELPARWASSRFLYKWLSFCLRQGHRFST